MNSNTHRMPQCAFDESTCWHAEATLRRSRSTAFPTSVRMTLCGRPPSGLGLTVRLRPLPHVLCLPGGLSPSSASKSDSDIASSEACTLGGSTHLTFSLDNDMGSRSPEGQYEDCCIHCADSSPPRRGQLLLYCITTATKNQDCLEPGATNNGPMHCQHITADVKGRHGSTVKLTVIIQNNMPARRCLKAFHLAMVELLVIFPVHPNAPSDCRLAFRDRLTCGQSGAALLDCMETSCMVHACR